jgi:uncharacterized membrane protein (DUF106 family)
MLELWNRLCLGIFDTLLGWLLALPSDIILFVVAIGSALILTLVRRFTTNQDLLRRASADRRRLRTLIRHAKLAGDRDAVKRYRATRSMIALRTLSAEGRPLLASILPIAMLATWCIHRLEFHPPGDGQPMQALFYCPVSAIGSTVHLVPEPGISVEPGYIRPIELGSYNNVPQGVATWTVRAAAGEAPHRLTFRYRDQTFHHDLLVGQRTYLPTFIMPNEHVASELKLRQLKLFGILPGIEAIVFPPWLVAYLLIVIPFVFISKRVLGIY